ncbi:MAG TPA: alanine--tRNA ligase [Chloroflexota bacterium]|nr:alanine--tRNA ligase [Chloroflexota bacterium]
MLPFTGYRGEVKKMLGRDIRELFLRFFESKGHLRHPSSSLVPQGDPTLMFTSAGMVQMKPYFLGEVRPPATRLTTAQKVFRTTDIEDVGDESHLTFFEMMGNFSVGDYFKEGTIRYGWEFSTEWLKFPADRIWVTIHPDDDEARRIWRDAIGLPVERIVVDPTNWWGPAGETGPCGPDSEMYLDRGIEFGCGEDDCSPTCECPRFLEYWNHVFMQVDQDASGQRTPLEQKNVDTGLGLERVAMLAQGTKTVHETDLFSPIIRRAEELTGRLYGTDENTTRSLRVIADHSRACTFLVADGVLPSNDGRGNVLRRILRRAVRHGRLLGREEPFLRETASVVVEQMGGAYPELFQRQDFILKVIEIEEAKFSQTLAAGLTLLEDLIARTRAAGQDTISGEDAFRLYDTFGFPRELTIELAAEAGLGVGLAEFDQAMARQREQARAAARFGLGQKGDLEAYRQLPVADVTFLGYDQLSANTSLIALIRDGALAERADEGDTIDIILRETPFYAESGGQVGDTGEIVGPAGRAEVLDTQRPVAGLIVHRARVTSGYLTAGDEVTANVDAERRAEIMRHHTATHLLHRALRRQLGTHVQQAGSLVAPDRLRFDFSHFSPISSDQLRSLEREVNAEIRADWTRNVELTTYQEAVRRGAMALFGEKYGDTVRMVEFGDYSRELCGGTHVDATGQIGSFIIMSESSIAAGVRRIEALAGATAENYVRERLAQIERLAGILHSQDVEGRVVALQTEVQAARRQVEQLQQRQASGQTDELLARAQQLNGFKVLSARVDVPNLETLRKLGDQLRARLGPSVVTLGAVMDSKPSIIVMVSPGVKVHAGEIARRLGEAVEGKGGGRPDVAQAGGRNPAMIDQALALAVELVRDQTTSD